MKPVGKIAWMAGMALGFNVTTAGAALTAYNPNGVDLIYSSVSDLTWSKDANLLSSMMQSQGYSLIGAIINASPTITYNTVYGISQKSTYNLQYSDFDFFDRTASWFGAMAFTNYLNSINYGGSNQWRLPNAGNNPIQGYNQTDNEFGQLFYTELSGVAYNNIPDTNYFNNEQTKAYWSGTETGAYAPDRVWLLSTYDGYRGYLNRYYKHNVWAVTPGQVAAVPVPGAVWLMSSGLFGFLGLNRRNRKIEQV